MLISPPAPAREGFGLSRTERPGLHDGGEGAEVGLNGLENRGDDRGCLGTSMARPASTSGASAPAAARIFCSGAGLENTLSKNF